MHISTQKRPQGVLVLCILTILNTGFSIFSNLLALISKPNPQIVQETNHQLLKLSEAYDKLEFKEGSELIFKFMEMNNVFYENYYSYHLSLFILSLLGIFSAIFMLRQKSFGFHLYIIYNLLSISSIYLFVKPDMVPTIYIVVMTIISLIMVALYSIYRKWLFPS